MADKVGIHVQVQEDAGNLSQFTKLCNEFEQVLAMDSDFRQRWLRLRETGEGIIKEQGFTIFQMEKDWREKADKWDKYTLDGQNITPEIIEAIEVAECKLEAIRKHMEKHKVLTSFDFNILMDEVEALGE